MRPIALIINDLTERDLIDLGRRVAVKHACSLEEALGPRPTHSCAPARHEVWANVQSHRLLLLQAPREYIRQKPHNHHSWSEATLPAPVERRGLLGTPG